MVDISALANTAVQIFRSGGATGWKSAARQAVIRSGVSSTLDVERIASEICRHLQQRSTAVKKAKKRREQNGFPKSKSTQKPKQLILL